MRSHRTLLGLTLVTAMCGFLAPSAPAEPTSNGAGASWFDCDNDGDLDIVFLKRTGQAFLYENRGGNYVNITADAIPAGIFQFDKKVEAMSTTCADFDNDGWVDIFITAMGENILLMNNGDATFRNMSTTARIEGDPGYLSSASAPIDYNNDGWLDIFVANHRGEPCWLYENRGPNGDGELVFAEKGATAGVRWGTGDAGTATYSVLTGDYDNDGDVDMYLVNDFEEVIPNPMTGSFDLTDGPDILYRNNGDGTFTDVSDLTGANDPGHGMGGCFGDYDNDGDLDIFITNFWEDTLLENSGPEGGYTFTNVTLERGINTDVPVEDQYNGWGTNFFDFDNDGDLDIHVANGFITNDGRQPPDQPDQLFRNQGASQGFSFVDISVQAGINQIGDGRGVTYGDYDHDGFLDFFIINSDCIPPTEPGELTGVERALYHNMKDGTFKDVAYAMGFRSEVQDKSKPVGYANYAGNHWIQVRPVGAFSAQYTEGAPVTPFGTRITVTVGEQSYIRELAKSSFASQNSPYLHFGLGSATMIDELRVRFPNGVEQVVEDVPVDQIMTIHEVDGVPVGTVELVLSGRAEGVQLDWSYNPDQQDLEGFIVSREYRGQVSVLADHLQGKAGHASFTDRDPIPGATVTYILEARSLRGDLELLARREYTFDVTPGFRLMSPRPNPFAGVAEIPVSAASPGWVQVQVVDISGRVIRTLEHLAPAGESLLRWDGLDASGNPAAAGVYYLRTGGPRQSVPVKIVKLP